jgi:3-hydroxy-3-methylglutaryl CoA synthase
MLSGGAGAATLLVGPNAPLVLDPAWRATHADNSHEFCKPADGMRVQICSEHACALECVQSLQCEQDSVA